MSFLVYVASSYQNAPYVRAVHEKLRAIRMEPSSSWAGHANGPEPRDLSVDALRAIAARNDSDLLDSHAVLVIAHEQSGETFAELRLALERQLPVVYMGERRILSAYRPGVVRVESIVEALYALTHVRDAYEPRAVGGGR